MITDHLPPELRKEFFKGLQTKEIKISTPVDTPLYFWLQERHERIGSTAGLNPYFSVFGFDNCEVTDFHVFLDGPVVTAQATISLDIIPEEA